ncbi:unnamed protein product [Phyllotreta striolata]|uniref:Peptidase S1 domain-containing protein n=1 Tax=Phyllotreta striolata TaxID=444603 RepID=A0A9N9TN79_PHYSR|nr:unnamed protein product [Phyllotreta striolata]
MFKFVAILVFLVAVSANKQTPFVHPNARNANLLASRLTIINGKTAAPHQFPYQVGIYVTTPNYIDFCGGSLISSNYVLTAAHCLESATNVKLIFGAQNITDPSESTQVQLKSESFVVHEGWNPKTYSNDIALIKLPTPVKETNAIKIVSLARGERTYSHEQGAVAGWGISRRNQKGVTPILQYITPYILSNRDCKNIDQNYAAVITDLLLCISPGYSKLSTCQGDSGGPLAVNGIQVGLVSFGATDCLSGKPSVFTRINKYESWISKNSDVHFLD